MRLIKSAVGADLAAHLDLLGPARAVSVAEITASGLRGRGGGWFPTARKMQSLQPRRVVVNGMEGEPLSRKDGWLLERAPHLVLDGAVAAAQALGVDQAVIAVPRLGDPLRTALAQRRDPIRVTVAVGPERYLSGQETALVRWIDGKPATPTSQRSADTFVSNTETYAHLALIARYGPEWFRSEGTAEAPGTMLVTLSGAVAKPGVEEVPVGIPLGSLLNDDDTAAVLCGGYGGAWLSADQARTRLLGPGTLGVVSVISHGTCGLEHTLDIARWMAGQGAQQCGPCKFGLPAVAEDLRLLGQDPGAYDRLRTRLGLLPGRGGCGHPDGVARLITSALEVFSGEADLHRAGQCTERRAA
jgi:NADH:ubiquinone oxidoreductase subunit F (NADH-binding)